MRKCVVILLLTVCILVFASCKQNNEESKRQKDNSPDILTDVAAPNLTMDTLISLVDIYGDEMTWSTFESYYYEDIGSGLYIRCYPIDTEYELWVGGGYLDQPPFYIRLVSKLNNNYIDLYTESIKDFISQE